jgi:hypothetical protein
LFLPLFILYLPVSLSPPPLLPQLVNTLPLLSTHLPPADYTTVPTVHTPSTLKSLTQVPSTTIVELHTTTHKGSKTKQLTHLFPQPHLSATLLVPLLPITQVSVFNQITITTIPNPTVYRYYHQGVFDTI